MDWEVIIAGAALFVAGLSSISAWRTSKKANRLQQEVLQLSMQANEFEVRKGELLLMSILSRYFVIQANGYKLSRQVPINKNDIDHLKGELELINNDVKVLISNTFYLEVFQKYPEINLLWMSLRQSNFVQRNSDNAFVNPQTFQKFFDLYFKVKNELSNKSILDNQYYRSIDESAVFLKSELDKSIVEKFSQQINFQ